MCIEYGAKLRKLKALINWIWKAETIDTIDSPFLADFINQIIWKGTKSDETIDAIEDRRGEYLNSYNIIKTTDFGAGSISGKSKDRSIAEITKNAVSSKEKCKLLFNILRYYEPDNILELGTSLGISTLYLAKALPNSQITTIEGDLQILGLASSHKISGTENIHYINAEFEQGLNQLLSEGKVLDLIIVDGAHHSKLQNHLLPYYKSLSHETTIWIIDDIYWSEDMTMWWDSLKTDPQFNIAIDLFHFGILYKSSQIKEAIDVSILPKKIRWKLGLTRSQY